MRGQSGTSFVLLIACPRTAKPLSEPKLAYCDLNIPEQTSIKFKSNITFFIDKISDHIVGKTVVIVFRPQCFIDYQTNNETNR